MPWAADLAPLKEWVISFDPTTTILDDIGILAIIVGVGLAAVWSRRRQQAAARILEKRHIEKFADDILKALTDTNPMAIGITWKHGAAVATVDVTWPSFNIKSAIPLTLPAENAALFIRMEWIRAAFDVGSEPASEGPSEKSGDRQGWWTVLGVNPDATEPEIQAAYRDLVKQNHPDHGGSEVRMVEINVARDLGLRPFRTTHEAL